jgi:tetratricopeptide (TPR) repeat protein
MRHWSKQVSLIGLLLPPVLCSCLTTSAARARAEELTPRAIYQRTLGATAWVALPTSKTNWDVGTACVVNRSRKLLVTSFHVVRERDSVLLLFPAYDGERLIAERTFYMNRLVKGECVKGKVLDVDPKRDLAVIEAESLPDRATELKLAKAPPFPGDRLHAVGNPAESTGQWLYITGTVRQVHRTQEKIDGQDRDARVVAAQLPISQGDSGGPVVNDEGALVGIAMSYTRKSPSLGMCVAAEEVQALLKQLDPRTAEEFNRRGERFFQGGLWERAAADFTSAVRLDAKRPVFYRNRAWTLRRQGKNTEAIADFTKAVDLAPTDATYFNDRGFVNLDSGHLKEARADFAEAIRIDPKYALAHNNRGFVHFKLGKLTEAIADYSSAIELGLKDEVTYNNRGMAYLEKGELDKAIADFTEAISIHPQYAAAYFNRGRAHAANKDEARAKADRDKAIELDPSLAKQ